MQKATQCEGVWVIQSKEPDKWLFLRPDEPDWLVTNDTGAAILSRCAGCDSLQNIAADVGLHDTDVINFVERVRLTSRLFHDQQTPRNPIHEQSAYQVPTGSAQLRSVHLNLTQDCNLDCAYCYATDRLRTQTTLTLEQWKCILRQIREISKAVTVSFTGGEPLLSACCLGLASYSQSLGNRNHLLTNGTAITSNNAARVSRIFDLIRISIDGSNRAIHEAHRGRHSFEKAMRAVDLLIQQRANIVVAMTVTRKNANDVATMCKRFGTRLSFQPLFKAGSAASADDLSITGEQYYEALSKSQETKPLGALETILAGAKRSRNRKCAIGDIEISIAPNGDVFPCHMLHQTAFCAGNAISDGLATIYNDSPTLKQCRNLTVENIEGCKDCPIRYICGGSCRARSYFETGSLLKAGEFCAYEKLAFIDGIFASSRFD